jgi:uncharacterized protein (TIGR02266 family)
VTLSDPTAPRGPFDQRVGPRVELRRGVSLKFKEFQGFVNETLENISAGGMFIRTTTPPPVGTVFDFELVLEDDARPVHGLGEVVWAREEDDRFDRPAGMGVRFLSLEPESRERIDRLLAERPDASVLMAGAIAQPDLDAGERWWEDRAPPEPALEGEEPAPPSAAVASSAAAALTPPGPSPYAYARSYRGSAVARAGRRRPRPILVILLVVVVLVVLAAAVLLLFPNAAMRLLLGEENRAEADEPLEIVAADERAEPAAEPVVPVAPSEAAEPLGPPPGAGDAGAGGEAEGGEPGFFDQAPGPAEEAGADESAAAAPPPPALVPAPTPARVPLARPEEPLAPAGAFSRVLNVIWEGVGEELVVTVFLDGAIEEWNYSVSRLETPPPRALVRIQGIERPFARSAIPVGNELVERIRLGFHPGARASELHLVLDLATPDAGILRSEAAGSELRLVVGKNASG